MATSARMIDWWVSSREMATFACGLIDGDFCLWFDWWRLLPVFWWMATSANSWLMVFVLRNGDLCPCFDWWRLLLVFWWMTFYRNGWLMGFILRNGNIYQTSNRWVSSPRNIYFTISRDFIMGCYLFSGLSPLQWRWLVRFVPLVAWFVRFAPSAVKFAPSVALLRSFYLFSGLIKELLPLQWLY